MNARKGAIARAEAFVDDDRFEADLAPRVRCRRQVKR